MSTFNSTKKHLSKIIEDVEFGKIQLPDFQRGWIWDDEHIKSLLISITRSFPIGSIMLLQTGGNVKFQTRLIEGVENQQSNSQADFLILDGQQRLTSLFQALRLNKPVLTKDGQKKLIRCYYYFDINKMLSEPIQWDEAIINVDENKQQKENFGRDIVLDLSSDNDEYKKMYFPCNQILNSDKWEEGLMAYDQDKFPIYMKFRTKVLKAFREYEIPIIELLKETTKEAVCLVFEKVNTGGVPLSVFELMTASYAAENFNLREDWFVDKISSNIKCRKSRFKEKPLLRDIEPNEFLQAISILHTYSNRLKDIEAGKKGKEISIVSAKREHVLALPLTAYKQWAEKLTKGFFEADRFLRMEGFHDPKFLPYRTQLIPLATLMVHLEERWLEPIIYSKISRWFWCGVFGELYGSASETRIALDHIDLLAWINKLSSHEPTTIVAAGFQKSRLDTLRTRTSAAYRGLYVLLQRNGAKDFFWKAKITELDRDECKIDIHHIFPQDWCKKNSIEERFYNSIVNKTPISYKANRMIGGKAPSEYLAKLQNHQNVQLSEQEMNNILTTHLIAPNLLRENNFNEFYEIRKNELCKMVENVMGKSSIDFPTNTEEYEIEEETDDDNF